MGLSQVGRQEFELRAFLGRVGYPHWAPGGSLGFSLELTENRPRIFGDTPGYPQDSPPGSPHCGLPLWIWLGESMALKFQKPTAVVSSCGLPLWVPAVEPFATISPGSPKLFGGGRSASVLF
jgi:hypothetical protein